MEILTKVIGLTCVVVVASYAFLRVFRPHCCGTRWSMDPALSKALSKEEYVSLITSWAAGDTETQRLIVTYLWRMRRDRTCVELFNYLSDRYAKAQPSEKANIIAAFQELGKFNLNLAVQRMTIGFLNDLVKQKDENLIPALKALGSKVTLMGNVFLFAKGPRNRLHAKGRRKELMAYALDALLDVVDGEYDSDAKVEAQRGLFRGEFVVGYKDKIEQSLRRLYAATDDQHVKCHILISFSYIADRGDQFLCDGIQETIKIFDELTEEEAYWLMLTMSHRETLDLVPFLDIAKHYFPDSERYQFQVRRNRERLSDEQDKEQTSS